MIDAVALTSDHSLGWQLFPLGLQRVYNFCQKYDSDADPAMLCAAIKREFIEPNPKSAIILAMDTDESGVTKPVGHLLVSLESWYGTKMATIVQYEVDGGTKIPRAQLRECFGKVERWALLSGAKFLQCMARGPKEARAFSIFYGMQPQRTMMRKTIEAPPSTGVATPEEGRVN